MSESLKPGDEVQSIIRGWFGQVMEIDGRSALVCWDGVGVENWIGVEYIRKADRTRITRE